MPRSRSSGALSIWSKAVNWASLRAASTLVIAAVRVVLPWSIWPIVPTFACGLVRSNLALPMVFPPKLGRYLSLQYSGARASLLAFGIARGKFLENVLRHGFVCPELHRVVGASLRHRTQSCRISEHVGQRNARLDHLGAGAAFHVQDLSAPRVEVADHVAHEFLRRHHFHIHHRLQQDRIGLLACLLEG